ncbi:tyrosine-type recombinase/integrase [Stieleria magnilauensis]|uniref:tyrosine-type recombinase/integrase n=1 Tax=Stieleria magnilauensis TaxID=2527963 RepID=UPI003AF6D05F
MIAQAFEAWLSKTESTATRTAYRNDVKQFMAFQGLEIEQLEAMTQFVPDDVTRWRDYLLAAGGRPDHEGNPTPGENSTVARKITSLRSFFSFLQNYGYRGANPAAPDFVKSPKVSDKGLTPSILPKRVGHLLDAPDPETPSGIRDRAVLAVFAYMALRVDELHHINVGNISRDGEHTVIRIKGKGNEIRRGVIPPIAAAAVTEWITVAGIANDRSGPLFRPGASARGQGRDGFVRRRMTVRAIQQLVKKHCQAVGIDEEVSVHSLRVTAATEADKAGIPLIDIQHWLGHKDPRTTLRYIRGVENLDRSPAYTIRYG